jgi:hypothetical protein
MIFHQNVRNAVLYDFVFELHCQLSVVAGSHCFADCTSWLWSTCSKLRGYLSRQGNEEKE